MDKNQQYEESLTALFDTINKHSDANNQMKLDEAAKQEAIEKAKILAEKLAKKELLEVRRQESRKAMDEQLAKRQAMNKADAIMAKVLAALLAIVLAAGGMVWFLHEHPEIADEWATNFRQFQTTSTVGQYEENFRMTQRGSVLWQKCQGYNSTEEDYNNYYNAFDSYYYGETGSHLPAYYEIGGLER